MPHSPSAPAWSAARANCSNTVLAISALTEWGTNSSKGRAAGSAQPRRGCRGRDHPTPRRPMAGRRPCCWAPPLLLAAHWHCRNLLLLLRLRWRARACDACAVWAAGRRPDRRRRAATATEAPDASAKGGNEGWMPTEREEKMELPCALRRLIGMRLAVCSGRAGPPAWPSIRPSRRSRSEPCDGDGAGAV